MQAIVQTGYGAADLLELREIDKPAVGDSDVLVRVRAASLHAGDHFTLKGDPYLVRFVTGWPKVKKNFVPGLSFAGLVETVGKDATRFAPGDEVFGECRGACAEYAFASQATLAPKPVNLTFEQAAAVPTSALAALQGLRDAGKVQSGQRVLINGASGGVGTFAVQIAKHFGAEVTGVCSTGNVDMVRSIGADHVIDYTQQDFTQAAGRYDLIFDNVGNRSFSEVRGALAPQGILLPNTGNAGMGYILSAFARSVFVRQQGRPLVSMPNAEDLGQLKELVEAGKLEPVIDRTYRLDETPAAFDYIGRGHARGKVVITVQTE